MDFSFFSSSHDHGAGLVFVCLVFSFFFFGCVSLWFLILFIHFFLLAFFWFVLFYVWVGILLFFFFVS